MQVHVSILKDVDDEKNSVSYFCTSSTTSSGSWSGEEQIEEGTSSRKSNINESGSGISITAWSAIRIKNSRGVLVLKSKEDKGIVCLWGNVRTFYSIYREQTGKPCLISIKKINKFGT